jgi:signal peptidase I
MFDKWMQYSYAAQKHQQSRYLKFVLIFFILFIVFNCVSAFIVSVWKIDNDTMSPTLSGKDRVVFNSFMMPVKNTNKKIDELPFERGSIVLLDAGNEKKRGVIMRFLDSVIRFFTAQQFSIISGNNQYYVKRIIAFPGDEIYMNNFVFRVKPSGSPYSLTEFELAKKPYHPSIPNIPAIWDEAIPFSGSFDSIIIGPNECFVVSDDRSNTNDSRTFGAVPLSSIKSKAVLRFWPITKFELL